MSFLRTKRRKMINPLCHPSPTHQCADYTWLHQLTCHCDSELPAAFAVDGRRRYALIRALMPAFLHQVGAELAHAAVIGQRESTRFHSVSKTERRQVDWPSCRTAGRALPLLLLQLPPSQRAVGDLKRNAASFMNLVAGSFSNGNHSSVWQWRLEYVF